MTMIMLQIVIVEVTYIFERNIDGNWEQKSKLTADDAYYNDKFGMSVAISGNYAIVGVKNDDSNKGSAYIFERNSDGTWTKIKKILASDGEAWSGELPVTGDWFGYSCINK